MSPLAEKEARMTRARGEVDQELEVISKYEQEPEFRDFVKNLLRCRSLASLDDNKEQSDERKDDLKVLDVKKRNDDIEVVDVKRRHQHVMRERRQGDERCGRGEDGGAARANRSRPISDIYRDNHFTNESERAGSDTRQLHRTSTASLGRREQRASVALRERRQQLLGQREEARPGQVFTLPRLSCYHRSTRLALPSCYLE